jgi:lipoprotein-anchoring transpeptidase ErfK/SrfK
VRTETAALAGKLVAALESPIAETAPTRVADATPPAAPSRQMADLLSAPRTHVAPQVQAVPAQPPSQAAGPNEAPQADSDDDTDARVSELDPAPKPATVIRSPAANPQPAQAAPSATSVAAESPAPAVRQQRVAESSQPQISMAPDSQSASEPPPVTPGMVTAVPNLPEPSTAEIAQVEQRLKDNLTSEMFNNFELFLYVSKSASGPWSQRMFVFQKEPTGDLAMAYSWPVSTGREKVEYNAAGMELPTNTPAGYYELDPRRFFQHYVSGQWGEPMPYAMFFNWKKNGQQTGLAIHSASGDDVGLLGTRASAGCVRLPPDASRLLFNLIKSKYRGLAPRFAIDRTTGTMSNDGIIVHDADGHVQLAEGYKVLVFIEDYGGENVVAAMY